MPTILKPKRKPTNSAPTDYDTARRRIYNSTRWQRLRDLKFRNDPLCERCAEAGIVRPAEDIHHIVSFMSTDDPERRRFLAFDYDNLQSLCKQCHQRIHNAK